MARISFSRGDEDPYPRAIVSLLTPRAEQAIAGAVTAIKGEVVETDALQRTHYALAAKEWTEKAISSKITDPSSELPPDIPGAKMKDTFQGYRIEYVASLLRAYRPNFDALELPEKAALVNRVLEKVNPFLRSLRELLATIQHAHPYTGLPNTPIKKASRDIRAAEKRDIENLTFTEIGYSLDIKQSENDKVRNDNYRVRVQLVPSGRKKLIAALGELGYQNYIDNSKAELRRWSSLSEEAQDIERFAETIGISTEKMKRILFLPEEEAVLETEDLDDTQRLQAAVARGFLNLST